MLHIYYGNGKGKTTAAVGLIIRACGADMKTAFFQFLKNDSSSEISVLQKLNGSTIVCCKSCNKFTFSMNESEKLAVTAEHNKMLDMAEKMVKNGQVQLIVLDEVLDAYNKKLIDTNRFDSFLSETSDMCEIVLTGRSPSEKMIESADYLTEMCAIKHPFDKGIAARKGIEY